MRLSTILTTTLLTGQASARWLAWTPDQAMDLRGGDLARPTQSIDIDDYEVWAPEPTPPPSKAIVDLLLHRRVTSDSSSTSPSSNNTWENDQTCGWYSGISSKPYVCDSPLSCSTDDGVVACATEGLEQFYTVCLNYAAVKSGKCSSVGVQTGCCQDSAQPECGTFIWAGAQTRSMFKCFASETVISMIDEPQYVIDSSRSAASASSASSVSAAAAASRSSAEAASQSRSGNGPSTVIATTTAADGATSTFTSVVGGDSIASASAGAGGGNGGGSGGGSSTNTGAIAGGIVGGLSLLALLIALLLWYLIRKKKGNKLSLSLCGGKRKTNKEKHVHNKNYNEKNVTNNDRRAYDKRLYDKRAYDNGRSYDNRSYNEETSAYGQRSRSVTPPNKFHFHIEDDRYDTVPDTRSSGSRTPPPPVPPPAPIVVMGAAAAAAAAAPSRREQRRQARNRRSQQQQEEPKLELERDLEMEEMEQAREQQDYRTHRYHPSSGRRYHDASRTPTPPSVPQPPAPSLDFIGRGI